VQFFAQADQPIFAASRYDDAGPGLEQKSAKFATDAARSARQNRDRPVRLESHDG
jgi:hypothetical protein